VDKGIKKLPEDQAGRVELVEQNEIEKFTLRPSPRAVEEIARLEESALMAEQRLGMFLVG